MPGFELIDGLEADAVADVFKSGGVLFRHGFDAQRGDSYQVRDFETEFAAILGVTNALAVSSGTAALRVALAALGIGPGDEVIFPAFTFVATAEAIIESGATPKAVNIDSTLNLCPAQLTEAISNRTKAVICVHMLGVPADLRSIKEICTEHGLYLIEDTAWGCGGFLDGKALGTWGDAGTFSFDYAKTITTGEGGMVVFQDENAASRAAAWHDHGHENNPLVPRWEDTRSSSGFNFRMMELQGAVGRVQLKKLRSIVDRQREIHDLIRNSIAQFPDLTMRAEVKGSFASADALVFSVPSRELALVIREKLLLHGLGTKILPEAITWHFAGTWEHMPELMRAHAGCLRKDVQFSENILNRCVALPISIQHGEKHSEIVNATLSNVFKK